MKAERNAGEQMLSRPAGFRPSGVSTSSQVGDCGSASSGAEVLSRVLGLLPGLAGRADEIDTSSVMPNDVVAALKAAGVFRILQPAAFGGSELGFSFLAEVAMSLGTACASTSWLAVVLNGWWLLCSFPERAQREIADQTPGAVIGAVFAPTTDVTCVPGGFRLSGYWPFSSGIDHTDYLLLGGFVQEEGPPDVRLFLVPRCDISILDDWDSVGLRGTGSRTTVVKDAFVPEYCTVLLSQLREGDAPGALLHASPCYRIPFGAIFPLLIATPAVGIATGALDRWTEWARNQLTRAAIRVADYIPLQLRLGEAAAQIDCARFVLRNRLSEVEAEATAGRIPRANARAVYWRDGAYSAQLCRRAIQTLFEASGGIMASKHNPFQRSWRDLQTLTAHISLRWDEAAERFGRSRLGLEPNNVFFN